MATSRRVVPVWPSENQEDTHRMTYLFGEARWYLWLKHQEKQKLSALRRDLLLLHNNGDLEHVKSKETGSSGAYVTALIEDKMIRGRITHSQSRSESKRQKNFSVLDVDEGRTVKLARSALRVLPDCAMELPAQAVRCDLGLDCKEQFKWPKELDVMLTTALKDAVLLVKFISVRPGSIPTISAEVSLCNESTGVTVSLQDWLRDYFSPHLELCSLDQFKPAPIGSTETPVPPVPPVPSVNGMGMLTPEVISQLLLQSPWLTMPHLQLPLFNQILPPQLQLYQQITGLANGFPPTRSLPPPGYSQPVTSQSPAVSTNTHGGCHPSAVNEPALNRKDSNEGLITSSEPVMQNVENHVNEPSTRPEPGVMSEDNHERELETSTGHPSNEELNRHPETDEIYCSSVSSCVEVDLSVASSSDYDDPLGPMSMRKRKPADVSSKPGKDSSIISTMNTVHSSASQSSHYRDSNKAIEDGGAKKALPVSRQPTSNMKTEAPATASLKDWLELVIADHEQPSSSASGSSSLSALAEPFVPKSLGSCTSRAAEDGEKIKPQSLPSTVDIKDGTSNNANEHVVLKEVPRTWTPGTVVKGFISHIWDPSIFEVNIVDEIAPAMEDLQNEMNDFYSNTHVSIKSKSHAHSLVGEFCAYFDPNERMWVRGQVHNWDMDKAESPVVVWCVDYGGLYEVDYHNIQPLVGELICSVPILATICTMKNVRPRVPPPSKSWPSSHVAVFKQLMSVGNLYYIRIDGEMENDCWPVSVFLDSECSTESINELLVEKGCAFYVHSLPRRQTNNNQPKENTGEEEWDPMKEDYMLAGKDYSVDDEDACVAVSGRKPLEEIGLCWFYQRNGYCYKKMCSLRHESLDPDGYVVGEVPTYTASLVEFEYPEPGERIELKITRIMNVHHFIAQISRPAAQHSVIRDTLPSLLQHLNSNETRQSLKSFLCDPAIGEVVFAEGQSGSLYRGRVINIDPDGANKFEIINVDSGKIEWVSKPQLRQLDTGFLYLPFQAVECLLAGVTPAHTEKHLVKMCINELADLVRKKKMKATVVHMHPWSVMEVVLWDSQGNSVAESLEAIGMVKKIHPSSQSKNLKVPGF